MMINSEILQRNADSIGVKLTDQQIRSFIRYYEMLIEKNKVMNLTAITEWEDVVIRHFTDSLSLVKCLDPSSVQTVLDLGTGAGFPGIPLKIAFPHLKVTLVDSLGKRVRFLEEVIDECHLDDITAVHSRAEDLARDPGYREIYDLCVSRAVAALSTLCEYCLPFVRTGGSFVAYKSGKVREELKEAGKAITILGGTVPDAQGMTEFLLPGTDMERILIRIRKEKPTPKKYPRKAGTPSKEPLS